MLSEHAHASADEDRGQDSGRRSRLARIEGGDTHVPSEHGLAGHVEGRAGEGDRRGALDDAEPSQSRGREAELPHAQAGDVGAANEEVGVIRAGRHPGHRAVDRGLPHDSPVAGSSSSRSTEWPRLEIWPPASSFPPASASAVGPLYLP